MKIIKRLLCSILVLLIMLGMLPEFAIVSKAAAVDEGWYIPVDSTWFGCECSLQHSGWDYYQGFGYCAITSHYGYRDKPTSTASSNHHGIDIAGSKTHGGISGANVYATRSGSVYSAKWNDITGNTIILKHDVNGETYYSKYEHLSKMLVKTNDTVKQGNTIGYVGSTGSASTGAHLDFRILKGGLNDSNYIDPTPNVNVVYKKQLHTHDVNFGNGLRVCSGCGEDYYDSTIYASTVQKLSGTIVYGTFATKSVYSAPYSTATKLNGLFDTTRTFNVVERLTNHVGENWYKVKYEKSNNNFVDGYIKCNRTEQNKVSTEPYYVPGPNVIDFTDVDARMKLDVAIPEKKSHPVYGVVTSSSEMITSVTAGIYNRDLTPTQYVATKNNINSKSFDLFALNDSILFSQTSAGKYVFRVSVTAGGKTQNHDIAFEMYGQSKPIPTYTARFESNNESQGGQSFTLKSGESIALNTVAIPTYPAHTFLGWARAANATTAEYTTADSVKLIDNLTLYAVWQVILPPAAPSLTSKSVDIAAGKALDIGWWSSNGAESYTVGIFNAANQQVKTVTSNGLKSAVTLQEPGVYTAKVKASNVAGESAWSQAATITVHGASTVVFQDYNGHELSRQTVPYGENAATPNKPQRTGYTFTDWDGALTNVKENRTLKAQYTPISYTVTFLDCNGDVASTQKVTYSGDTPGAAVEPSDAALKLPGGYIRIGWNTDEWKHVTRNGIVVSPCITWERTSLPITVSITSVSSYGANTNNPDGYYVAYTVKNNVTAGKSGRVVVALKTPSGKFVANTESGAFYIAGQKSYNGSIFIPLDEYNKGNNADDIFTVELYIVDRFASMTPLSPMAYTHVLTEKNSEWGPWMTADEYAKYSGSGDKSQYQTKTEYRYQTRSVTDWTTASAPSGWSLLQSRTSVTPWSGWSAWQTAAVSANDTRKIETRDVPNYVTEYRYGRYIKTAGGYHFADNVVSVKSKTPDYSAWSRTRVTPDRLSYYFSSSNNSAGTGRYQNGKYYWDGYLVNGSRYYWEETQSVVASYTKEYRYATRSYYNEYQYYKFSDWSGWSTTAVTASADRNVQTRTLYRVKEPTVAIPDTGYAVSGVVSNLENPNGRQVILTVYKVDSASDYTNEYVGQTTLDANGRYDFGKIVTFEAPSPETGDFTATLTIEGCDGALYIDTGDTFKVPRKAYKVEFMDGAERIGDVQMVMEGDAAVAPVMPEKNGYYFVGWDTGLANVRSDMVVNAVYIPKTYTVVFVDWLNGTVTMKNDIEYGTGVEIDDPETHEGYTFSGWQMDEGMNINAVTDHMVVTAGFEKSEFSVQFLNSDGSVLSEQTVGYGECAESPNVDDVAIPEGMMLLGWSSAEYQFVTQSMTIVPVFDFELAAPTAYASLDSGTYAGTQTVSLMSEEEGTITYSLVTASDYNQEEIEYTQPIEITESAILYVTSSKENTSSTTQAYEYIIVSEADMPEMPAEISAAANETAICVSWSAVPGATGYILSKEDAIGNTERFIVTEPMYTDENVIEQMRYTYSVISYKMLASEQTATMVLANGDAPSAMERFYGEQYAATSIKIETESTSVLKGNSVRLNAVFTPSNTYNQDVIWSVEPGNGSATITENGILTGISAGSVTVKALATDGSDVFGTLRLEIVEPVHGKTKLSISSGAVRKGENITVQISVDENSKAEMMQFALLYDSSILKIIDAKPGAAMETKSPTINTTIPGIIYFNWDSTEGLTEGGSLMDVTFEANNQNAVQTLLTIPVDTDGENEFVFMGYDSLGNMNNIECTVINGKINIIDVLFGDINNDGKINVVDANLIRRHAAQIALLNDTQKLAADVNGDGKVNVVDANLIRRYAAKIIDSFNTAG